MNPNIRKQTILKKKLLKATMFSMAIFVALLFFGSAVAASLAGSNETIENNYEKQLGDPAARAGVTVPVGSMESSPLPLSLRGDTFYAYNAYDPSAAVVEGPIYFDSDDPETVTLIAPTSSPQFIAGGCWVEDEGWYGSQYLGGLWTIDESTGAMTLVGSHAQTLNGLTYCDATDTMYGASSTDLYTVDMDTGATTLVGSFGIAYTMIGIACDGQGNMYGTTVDFSAIADLYSIDMTTGAATSIGSTGLPLLYAQDMEYDKENDELYLAAYTTSMGGQLYTCDTDTGATTLIGDFQGGMEVTGLAIPYISGPPPEHDLALQSIIKPESGTGSVITPRVSIRNRGLNDEVNIPVEMKIGKWDYTYYLDEDFEGGLPADWTVIVGGTTNDTWTDTNPGGRTPQGGCAGTFMIADSDYAGSGGIQMKEELISPTFDCSGAQEVYLEFAQYYQHLSSIAKIDISIDSGSTWTNLVTQTATTTGPTTIDLTAIAANESDVRLNFIYDDNGAWAWYWMVDNIQVYGKTFVPEYEEEILVSVPFNETLEFDFPDWVPDDLGVAENIDIDYFCEAEILYADNNTGNNYKSKDFILNYGYFYDIGVIDISSPVSGVGDTQIPEVTVENFGQNDVSAEVNMVIEENIGGGESVVQTWANPTGWSATTETFTLTEAAHGVGVANFKLAWVFDGNTYNMNNWNIDDIVVTAGNDTLFSEDFTGVAVGQIPAGWERNLDNWGVVNSALAGGTAPEVRFYWSPSATGRWYLITPYFDTSGYDELTLEFKHYLSHFSGAYTLEVVAIADEYVSVYDETASFDIASGEVLDVTLPAWTPDPPFADVDYLVTACTSVNVWDSIYEEYFDGTPAWTLESNWDIVSSSMAGGDPPELEFYWSPSVVGTYRAYSDPIDTTGETILNMEFKHYLSHFSGPYTIKVETTSDNVTWNEVWSIVNPTGSIFGETVSFVIDNADVGSDTFQIAFTFDGDSYNLNYWDIDDVILSAPGLGGDGNPDNDCMSKVITLEYLHDVGTVEIIPFSGAKDRDMFDL
ncbi:MAG: choice-of-anchor J domain-containing protein, partial [Thermoplasmatota archaeon]